MAGTPNGISSSFARSVRWALAPLTAFGMLSGVVTTAPGAGASPPCVINPGATGWTAADIAQAKDGHAIRGAAADTGAALANMYGYSGQQPDGRAVDVALIDSGVAPVAGLTSGNVVHGPDLSFESQSATLSHIDTLGHGTMMASVIAGRDKASFDYEDEYFDPTAFYGIAPKSRVVSIKVADSQGAVDVTQVIAAIDWVVKHAKDKPSKGNPKGFNIRVINLSYGVVADDVADVDALSYAVEQAWKAGIVVVAASGNGGRSTGKDSPGLTSPAYNNSIIAVGSFDNNGTSWDRKDDFIPPYTSGASSSNRRLPDFVAPGQHLTGLHVKGSTADEQMLEACRDNPDEWIPSVFGPNDRFIHGSGTSQAAAVASGAVAILLSKYPNATPDQIKKLLTTSAAPISDPRALAGNGALNLKGAMGATKLSNDKQKMSAVGGGTLDDARGTSIVYSCMNDCVALTGDKNIFGEPIIVGSAKGLKDSLQKLQAAGASWTKKGKCEAWMGAPMAGAKFVADKRLGTVWATCKWSKTNWAGQKWNTDTVHTWSSAGYWQGGASWARFSLTGDDWTRFSLRDNDWTRFSLRNEGWD